MPLPAPKSSALSSAALDEQLLVEAGNGVDGRVVVEADPSALAALLDLTPFLILIEFFPGGFGG
jgi:hypothetical protein